MSASSSRGDGSTRRPRAPANIRLVAPPDPQDHLVRRNSALTVPAHGTEHHTHVDPKEIPIIPSYFDAESRLDRAAPALARSASVRRVERTGHATRSYSHNDVAVFARQSSVTAVTGEGGEGEVPAAVITHRPPRAPPLRGYAYLASKRKQVSLGSLPTAKATTVVEKEKVQEHRDVLIVDATDATPGTESVSSAVDLHEHRVLLKQATEEVVGMAGVIDHLKQRMSRLNREESRSERQTEPKTPNGIALRPVSPVKEDLEKALQIQSKLSKKERAKRLSHYADKLAQLDQAQRVHQRCSQAIQQHLKALDDSEGMEGQRVNLERALARRQALLREVDDRRRGLAGLVSSLVEAEQGRLAARVSSAKSRRPSSSRKSKQQEMECQIRDAESRWAQMRLEQQGLEHVVQQKVMC